jgi:hypothetical protein
MSLTIKLEIDTGNGNSALVANIGTISDAMLPVFAVAFDNQPVTDLHGKTAVDALKNLDNAINKSRTDRAAFANLTAAEQTYRQQVLDFVTRWRIDCREHPLAVNYFYP